MKLTYKNLIYILIAFGMFGCKACRDCQDFSETDLRWALFDKNSNNRECKFVDKFGDTSKLILILEEESNSSGVTAQCFRIKSFTIKGTLKNMNLFNLKCDSVLKLFQSFSVKGNQKTLGGLGGNYFSLNNSIDSLDKNKKVNYLYNGVLLDTMVVEVIGYSGVSKIIYQNNIYQKL